jgi:hypothetical protein
MPEGTLLQFLILPAHKTFELCFCDNSFFVAVYDVKRINDDNTKIIATKISTNFINNLLYHFPNRYVKAPFR